MRRLLPLLLLALLGPAPLPAQSREETFAFLADEIQSLADKDYYIKEVSLSPDGKVFTLRKSARGKGDKGLVLPLDKVDIYLAEFHQDRGYQRYDLKVRSRGKDTFIFNGHPFRGVKSVVRPIFDERKARAMAQAFQRLIDLARGRKAPFPRPE